MSSEIHNWDDLVRHKLEQFSPEPPPEIWENIRSGLAGKKRERRLLVFRWAAIAAVLIFAMVTGVLVINNKPEIPFSSESVKPVPSVKSDEPAKEHSVPAQAEKIVPAPTPVFAASEKNKKLPDIPTGEIYKERKEMPAVLAMVSVPALARAPSGNPEIDREESRLVIRKGKSDETLPVAKDDHLLAMNAEKESTGRKQPEWKVGVLLTPGYSSYSADYSENYASRMSSAGNQPETNFGGGITIQYKQSKRLKIESGLYFARNGDNTGGAKHFFASKADYAYLDGSSNKFYSNTVNVSNGKISMNSTAGVIRLTRQPEDARLIAGTESAIGMNNTLLSSGEFYQVFDFVEIPLTARYRIIDRKIGIELLGGISTNLVVGNQVFLESNSGREYAGRTEDIAPVGFSGIAGLGVVYPLGKHVSLSVEPRGSYWINSLNNSGDVSFKPWRIGVYSGLTYTF